MIDCRHYKFSLCTISGFHHSAYLLEIKDRWFIYQVKILRLKNYISWTFWSLGFQNPWLYNNQCWNFVRKVNSTLVQVDLNFHLLDSPRWVFLCNYALLCNAFSKNFWNWKFPCKLNKYIYFQ